jgi:hypothetical protein
MLQRREDVAKLFKKAIEGYLGEHEPQYVNGHYGIKELRLQEKFAVTLYNERIAFGRERNYGNERTRIDFQIYDPESIKMKIEIEWEARQTDGFAKRTFEDLHKLDRLKRGEWGMFLALNIGNKYESHTSSRPLADASKFASNRTYLAKKWKNAGSKDLLKCNPQFWRWPYTFNNRGHTVTVLSCFGRRLSNGWAAE